MNWSDERYVRLYTRDTADWAALSWEARALFCLLLRKADRAGVVQVGPGSQRVTKIACLVQMPGDVVQRALGDLLADGCLVESELGYTFPNYVEAQEAEQTNAQRQRESRARRQAKGMTRVRSEGKDEWVTTGHSGSQSVTTGHPVPSLAVPSRTQKEEDESHGVLVVSRAAARAPRKPKEEKPAKPGWQELVDGLVESYELAFSGTEYQLRGQDFKALSELRGGVPDDIILTVWRWALQSQAFPVCRTIFDLNKHFNALQTAALAGDRQRAPDRRVALLAVDRPRGAM